MKLNSVADALYLRLASLTAEWGRSETRNVFKPQFVAYIIIIIVLPAMSSLLRPPLSRHKLPRELLTACAVTLSSRSFSVLNRPPPKYSGHVPLTTIERAGLAVGSAVISLFNPRRAGALNLRL